MEKVFVEELFPFRQSLKCHRAGIVLTLLQNWCNSELNWVMYEPANGPRLWRQVARHLNGYLGLLWLTGILPADQADKAFRVTCDQTTMTPADIQAGIVICQVGIASESPSKFILYRIRIRSHNKPMTLAVA